MLTLVVHSVGPKAMIKVMKTEKERGGQREQQSLWVAGGCNMSAMNSRGGWPANQIQDRAVHFYILLQREIVDFQYTQRACSFASDPKLEMKDASLDIQVTVA